MILSLTGLASFTYLGALGLGGVYESLRFYGVIVDAILIFPLSFVCFYTFYDFYCYRALSRVRKPYLGSKHPSEEVFVSIIVPTYNEPMQMVRTTLSALASLNHEKLEVIVADGSSSDYSHRLETLCEKEEFSYVHLDDPGGYNGPAILQAADKAKGEILGIVDSDYLVDTKWLKKALPYISGDEVAAVQCPQSYRNLENSVARVANAFRLSQIGVKLVRASEEAVTCTGTMVLHKKDLLRNLFPTRFATPDFVYSLRLISKGRQIVYLPKVMGRGLGPTSLLDYAAQQAKWLDNLRGLLNFSNELKRAVSFKKRIHVWTHGLSHLHHLAGGGVLLLGTSISLIDLTTGAYLLALYLGYLLYRLLRGRLHGALLRTIDTLTLMVMDVTLTPFLLEESIDIVMGKTSRYNRTPKAQTSDAPMPSPQTLEHRHRKASAGGDQPAPSPSQPR